MRRRRHRSPISKAWCVTTPIIIIRSAKCSSASCKAYADDLKKRAVFKPSTDTAKFAERIYVDVFACLRRRDRAIGRRGRSACRRGRCRLPISLGQSGRRACSRASAWVAFGAVLPVVARSRRLVADPRLAIAAFVSRGRDLRATVGADSARFGGRLAAARAVAAGAGVVPDAVGSRDRKARLAAAAVLPAAAGHPRSLHRRSAEAARQRLRLGQAGSSAAMPSAPRSAS